jgi:hypothetical protein
MDVSGTVIIATNARSTLGKYVYSSVLGVVHSCVLRSVLSTLLFVARVVHFLFILVVVHSCVCAWCCPFLFLPWVLSTLVFVLGVVYSYFLNRWEYSSRIQVCH